MTGLGHKVRAAWAAGLLALAGCSAVSQPMGPVRQPAALRDDAVIAADGYRLPLRSWRPQGPPESVLLALHGFNDYSNAYATVGPVLARHGILTYAYDQRGFGATLRPGIWPGTATLIADLETVTGLLLERHPGLPLTLLGESMGGAVVIAALADPQAPASPLSRVSGAVLVAPAGWGRETMGLIPRLALDVANGVAPGMLLSAPRQLGIRPSDNDEMLRLYSRDPLVIKGTRVDTIDGLVTLMSDALVRAPRFTRPSLLLYGSHDQILPPAAIRRMMACLPEGRQRRAVYRDGWHMLLRDRQGQIVVDDIVSWLKDPNSPLPSGADRLPLPIISLF